MVSNFACLVSHDDLIVVVPVVGGALRPGPSLSQVYFRVIPDRVGGSAGSWEVPLLELLL